MDKLAIISRPYWVENGYLHRVSAKVRGEEIAQHLGIPFNQGRGDVTIYVKPRSLRRVRDGDYVDILDEYQLVDELDDRPLVKVISMSLAHHEYLTKRLENEVIYIPHHHINFERTKRKKNERLVGGFIGSPSRVAERKYEEIRKALDVEFTKSFYATSREEMIEYYQSIDFLIITNLNLEDRSSPYRHPTKILNAASFGIPCIAKKICGYREVDGLYLEAETIPEIVHAVERLKNEEYYQLLSERLIQEAEKYHIEKISKLYGSLVSPTEL